MKCLGSEFAIQVIRKFFRTVSFRTLFVPGLISPLTDSVCLCFFRPLSLPAPPPPSRKLRTQSLEWYYNNVKSRFKRFGSAKVLKTLYRKHIIERGTLSELPGNHCASCIRTKIPLSPWPLVNSIRVCAFGSAEVTTLFWPSS